MSGTGWLLLLDLSGYTEFLTRTELAQAPGILQSLLGSLLDRIRPPLRVAEIEGDAIFVHAPADAFADGALPATMRELYCTFAAGRERMERNVACSCAGCAEFPKLDLKVIAHHGRFALHSMLPNQPPKPVGAEVVLAHRLLKNSIPEETGVRSYAFLTHAAVSALGSAGPPAGAIPHRETYPHLGVVEGWVLDLEPAWHAERERRLLTVGPEEAWLTVDVEVGAAVEAVWNRLVDREFRSPWVEGAVARTASLPVAPAAADRCFAGEAVSTDRVLDWEPLRRLTLTCEWPLGAEVHVTFELVPDADRTRVQARVARPSAANPLQKAAVRSYYRLRAPAIADACRRQLQQLAAVRTGEPEPQP